MEEKKMNSQQIEGRNAVMEAFRSGKPIDKVYILDGCQRPEDIRGSLHRQRLTSMRRWKICWSLQNRKGKILS